MQCVCPSSLCSIVGKALDISCHRVMKESKDLVYIFHTSTPVRTDTHAYIQRSYIAAWIFFFLWEEEYPSKFEFITILGHILWSLESGSRNSIVSFCKAIFSTLYLWHRLLSLQNSYAAIKRDQ